MVLNRKMHADMTRLLFEYYSIFKILIFNKAFEEDLSTDT